MDQICLYSLCFFRLSADGPKIFGYSEFLSGIALLVIAWTLADTRYRFRIRIAPFPLIGLTYWVVAVVGVLTLLTDLWRAERWYVPEGKVLTPAVWQVLLGGSLLAVFLLWVWFAFIRPPRYSTWNSRRFAETLYQIVVKGEEKELKVAADELTGSMSAVIAHCPEPPHERSDKTNEAKCELAAVAQHAYTIVLLIADRRFCRAVVQGSSSTIYATFDAMATHKKYLPYAGTFAKNIVGEALNDKNSFFFHEGNGYASGLLGYHKPLTTAMYSNWRMVEAIGTLLDLDYRSSEKWDGEQWEAYSRLVLITLEDYLRNAPYRHSFVLHRAFSELEKPTSDLYTLNGIDDYQSPIHERVRAVVQFTGDALDLFNATEFYRRGPLRIHKRFGPESTLFDRLADLAYEMIEDSAAVKGPFFHAWSIQHNTIWSRFFSRLSKNQATAVLQHKLRRRLYNQIEHLRASPNYQGSRVLRVCLNIMGLRLDKSDRSTYGLQRVVLAWIRRYFASLYAYNPDVATDCLPERITYDSANNQLVYFRPAENLRREPFTFYFPLDPMDRSHEVGVWREPKE